MANAYTRQPAAGLPRASRTINQNTTEFWDTVPLASRRRSSAGSRTASRSAPTTRSACRSTGTPASRSVCSTIADGAISLRADQAQYQELFKQLNLQRHVVKVNAVWDMPDMSTSGAGAAKKTVGYIVNDWQLSGDLHRQLRQPVRPRLQLPEQRREPEPDRLAGLTAPGSSTSAIRVPAARTTSTAQFNVAAVTAPTYWQRRPRIGSQHPDRVPEQDRSTSPWRARSAWAAAASSSSASTRSTRSTPSSTTVAAPRSTTRPRPNLTIRNPQYLADGSLDPDASAASERRLRRGDRRGQHA